jgi:hypothetical protein
MKKLFLNILPLLLGVTLACISVSAYAYSAQGIDGQWHRGCQYNWFVVSQTLTPNEPMHPFYCQIALNPAAPPPPPNALTKGVQAEPVIQQDITPPPLAVITRDGFVYPGWAQKMLTLPEGGITMLFPQDNWPYLHGGIKKMSFGSTTSYCMFVRCFYLVQNAAHLRESHAAS